MSVLKPLSAKWMVSAYDYIKNNPIKVFNGFRKSGIAERLDYGFQGCNPRTKTANVPLQPYFTKMCQ
ncbi:hypothetical protein KUTeg_013953 [Tegillarca granosa]|uniref:Uncharacterized protein n=1 Tax=Tegillarca granosa TaxID=220873 RepID=A0ABQ9EV77_TEGGR|nr:hypothetical protein KUTeg_013953 [Tegillarca granosa]